LTYDHADSALRSVTVDGDPIVDENRYRIATSEFLLHTDVEFPTLKPRDVIERLDTQYRILIDHAETEGITPVIEGRIAREGL
jgi:hypothetical protein